MWKVEQDVLFILTESVYVMIDKNNKRGVTVKNPTGIQ